MMEIILEALQTNKQKYMSTWFILTSPASVGIWNVIIIFIILAMELQLPGDKNSHYKYGDKTADPNADGRDDDITLTRCPAM